MFYQISCDEPLKHLITIRCRITNIEDPAVYLNLPTWRPGRYEIANFSKNIYKVVAEDKDGRPLAVEKTSKARWKVSTSNHSEICVTYQYFANQHDAGGSVANESLLYINFINCLPYVEERMNLPCEVEIMLPDNFKIACGLPQRKSNVLSADNYYHLVDSPMIASENLQHFDYAVENYQFHIWINGDWKPDREKLLSLFKNFTIAQISAMGSFPCSEYHFLVQIYPFKAYHGVEHYNSTIITLGPSEEMDTAGAWENFLGVSSHELFHTWNIIRIRPKEMMPYRFSEENYFRTGYVAEGFTTYYGDLFLLRGKAFSPYLYFDNLNRSLKRHRENFGQNNLSLAASSYDLWLDGYNNLTPNRKVSIYVKGSLVALMLDLTIRKLSEGRNNLDELMRVLWAEFGATETGYSEKDIQLIAEELAGASLENFFNDYVYGTAPLEEELDHLLHYIGFTLQEVENPVYSEQMFGLKTVQKDMSTIVSATAPGSVADRLLSRDDELVAVDGRKITQNLDKLIDGKKEITLAFFRNQELLQKKLVNDCNNYYRNFIITKDSHALEKAQTNYKNWSSFEW